MISSSARRVPAAPVRLGQAGRPPSPRPGLRLGVNYPWYAPGPDRGRTSWDFGNPPSTSGQPWGGRAEWRTVIDSDLAEFRRMGLKVVRWFVIADGLAVAKLHRDGLPSMARSRPRRANPELTAGFVYDVTQLVGLFDGTLQLMPTLLSYHAFAPPGPWRVNRTERHPVLVSKGGWRALASNGALMRRFVQGVVVPLLQPMAQRRHAIHSVDVCNEPDLAWLEHGVPRAGVMALLRACVNEVHRLGLRSTVGWARVENVGSAGESVRQVHFYGGAGETGPPRARGPGWVLGEFGSSNRVRQPNERRLALSRRLPGPGPFLDQSVPEKLRRVHAAGYAEALVWSRYAYDPPSDWSAVQRALAGAVPSR